MIGFMGFGIGLLFPSIHGACSGADLCSIQAVIPGKEGVKSRYLTEAPESICELDGRISALDNHAGFYMMGVRSWPVSSKERTGQALYLNRSRLHSAKAIDR